MQTTDKLLHANNIYDKPLLSPINMADWNTPTGAFKISNSSCNSKLTTITAPAGDSGFTADSWVPEASNSGGDGFEAFEDDTGYIGQNVSKHAGDDSSGCRK